MKSYYLSAAASSLIMAAIELATPGAALAQNAPVQGSGSLPNVASAALDAGDIVVTASKRAENVQNVPQAVQVLSGRQLDAQSVRQFTDLSRVAPSLIVRPEASPQNSSISIRGIGTYAFGIGVEPSVSVQVDDVPISIQARAFADLQDIERIEVLRGPQSTLYGKASSAGLINIITQAPTRAFTLRVNGIATTDREFGGGLTVSGPIGDEVGYRITSSYVDYRGNVTNLFNDDKLGGRKVFTLRGKLVWDSAAGVVVTLAGNYIHGDTNNGRPFLRLSPTALLRGNASIPASVFAPGIVPSTTNDEVSVNFPNGTKYEGYGPSLKLSYEIPNGPTLMSITSYDYFTLNDFQDHDETSSALIDNRSIGSFKAKQLTQEVRLLAPQSSRLRYTLGLFFADNALTRIFQRGPAFSLARWDATAGSEQLAAFGQLDFDILPTTTVIGGVRVQRENIRYTFFDILNGGAFYSGKASDDAQTYRLGVKQKLATDVSVFATYSTGYKGQSFDLTTGFDRLRQLAGPIKPETSRNIEVGVRSQMLQRRVTINATVFDTRFKNFQAQAIEFLADGTQNFRLTNVGRVRTRGVEVEVNARPLDDLNIGGSVAYVDAKITDFPGAQCFAGQTAAQGCVGTPARQDLKGFRPAQAPEWKLVANVDYSHDLGDLPFKGLVQANYSYQSRINYSLNQDPETVQGGFGIVNLGVGIRGLEGRYEVVGFVNNLLDKQYYANLINSSGNFSGAIGTQGIPPRDFARYGGIRASYSF